MSSSDNINNINNINLKKVTYMSGIERFDKWLLDSDQIKDHNEEIKEPIQYICYSKIIIDSGEEKTHYILTIGVRRESTYNSIIRIYNDCYVNDDDNIVTYNTHNYHILKIEDLNGNTYDKIINIIKINSEPDIIINYEVDKHYTSTLYKIGVCKVKEVMYFRNFYNDKQYLVTNFTGNYVEYHECGAKKYEFFMSNGVIEGVMKEYFSNQLLYTLINYVNGIMKSYIEYDYPNWRYTPSTSFKDKIDDDQLDDPMNRINQKRLITHLIYDGETVTKLK